MASISEKKSAVRSTKSCLESLVDQVGELKETVGVAVGTLGRFDERLKAHSDTMDAFVKVENGRHERADRTDAAHGKSINAILIMGIVTLLSVVATVLSAFAFVAYNGWPWERVVP